jgi:hypothetical protein
MPTSAGGPFEQVTVDYAIIGEVRVEWLLREDFSDPEPHSFQLQVNYDSGAPDAWEDVGVPVTDTCYAIHETNGLCGKDLTPVYRIVLTTPLGVCASGVAQVFGLLSRRQWLQIQAIWRRLLLNPTDLEHPPGYLLKRKIHGTPCTDCVDPFTGSIRNSECEACHGTGKIDGYWKAAEDTLYNISPEAHRNHRDDNQTRGTVDDVIVVGQFLGIPPVRSKDVWVSANSDRRYYVRSVRDTSHMMMVPITMQAELRLAPFSDIIYTIPVEA